MKIEEVRCFFPVGGQAKRLRPLTHDISKPCIRFLNRPLIEFSMATLAEQGVRNFIFGENGYTNYSNLFDQYGEGIGFSAKYNINPRVHIKHQPNLDDCGSADSYRLNIEYYDIKNPVLVVQGDGLFNIDLKNLITNHEKNKATMTIVLVQVENVEEYGIADLDENMKINRFLEKPKKKDAPSNFANAGIYLLSPEVRELVESKKIKKIIEKNCRFDFGYDLIPYLVKNNYPVYGHEIKVWYDVGQPDMYLMAMRDFLNGKSDIRVTEERVFPNKNIWVQGYSEDSIKRRKDLIEKHKNKKLFFDGSALIGRHARIDDYTKIEDSNIDNFCIIGSYVTIKDSAIMDAAKIGDYTNVSNSILGRKVIVESSKENPTIIESTSVLGNSVYVSKGCNLKSTKVNPGLILPPNMSYKNKFLHNYEDVVKLAS
ncbi:MAG: NDP-sugar synthase [Candidatus Bathyarchaeota archaeon]